MINRSTNRLTLYDDGKLRRTFPVATGPGDLPDAARHVPHRRQVPQSVVVPADLELVGEGAEACAARARRTRSARAGWASRAPGVGIHGTDAPASIGYSASHGCMRMQVPDAEWLFDHVDIGTTVHIV